MRAEWIRGMAVGAALAVSFACSSEPKPAPPTPAGPAATMAPATMAPATTAPPATSASSIGIPECDSYVTKYEACVNQYVPASQKATLQAALDANRNAWKAAAAQPMARATLAATCQQAEAAAKAAMSMYQCKW